MPSEKRPPEARWSPAAASAIVAGVRPHTEMIPLPKPIRDVRAASSASTISESWVQPSATSTRSSPIVSACVVRRWMTSTRVSKGVNPTPRRMRQR
jgi:hypothetical protein